MSDYVYRCEKCGDLRVVHNIDGPPERIDAYCWNCCEDGMTPHTLTECGRIEFDLGGDVHLTIFATESDESTLIFMIDKSHGVEIIDLNRRSSKHLATFLASEILGRGVSE